VTRIPHAWDVHRALRSVRAAAQKAQKGLNQVANQRMAKGDYAAAGELVTKGKEIDQFQLEVEALRKRWREVCGVREKGASRSVTPLWAYFKPILEALESLGGEARRTDLERKVERLIASSFLPGDRATMARGRERWRVMVQRARKPMVAEGWIEEGGPTWRITKIGRDAGASRDLAKRD
jgi:hypothetical protein